MLNETLLIMQRNGKVLLGYKNPEKKFGGMWNGFGGRIENKESLEESVIRETFEEVRIQIKNPRKRGEIHFKFPTQEPDHYVHIFTSHNYNGDLKPTEDFLEYKWFGKEELPDEMMPADKHWIPYLFEEKNFKGEVNFDKEFQNPEINIYEIEKFD